MSSAPYLALVWPSSDSMLAATPGYIHGDLIQGHHGTLETARALVAEQYPGAVVCYADRAYYGVGYSGLFKVATELNFEQAVSEVLLTRTAFLNAKTREEAERLSAEMRQAAEVALRIYTEKANGVADRLGRPRPRKMSLERFIRTVVISRRVS